MSFGHHTPETLLQRSDSKDPATTCKGLTTSGRACRRALAASAVGSAANSPNGKGNGVVAILDSGDAAAFFCWQHKDQADALVTKLSERTQVLPLKQKSSIDTLVERIGILELDDQVGNYKERQKPQRHVYNHDERRRQATVGSRNRDTLPQEWQRIQGPLMSVPEEIVESQGYRRPQHPSRQSRRYTSGPVPRPKPKASWFCCSSADDDELPPRRSRSQRDEQYPRRRSEERYRARPDRPRPIPRTHHQGSPSTTPSRRRPDLQPETSQRQPSTITYARRESQPHSPYATPPRPQGRSQSLPATSPPNVQTVALLSLIPPHLSPTTTSTLLSELSKPISTADEAGYIYMFWLTPETDASKPDDETASSLLDVDDLSPGLSPSRLPRNGTPNEPQGDGNSLNRHALAARALQRFASINHGSQEPKKILLKIGRANNVHRRLSQWTKQCGQNITLIRYYPYQRDQSPSEDKSKLMVPHVHRVERLVHLELADQRVAGKGQCEQCGREHREWFEVDATREGVRAVDEVVRRWVDWARGVQR